MGEKLKVLYTAPNRGHHYRYAKALHDADMLSVFVSGFSRFSPRAALLEIGTKLIRADIIQTVFLASLKFRMPKWVSAQLAFWAKKEQDLRCRKYLDQSDVFLFYSGSGLDSCKRANKKNKITIVEAVNSHVSVQEQILKEEHEALNIPWIPFHAAEKKRRLQEYNEADYILLPSDFVKKSFIESGFPEHKLLKIPYGFEQFNAVERTALDQSKLHVLYVGSVSIRKGLRYLIQAVQCIDPDKIELKIVGPQTVITGIEDLEISANIIFTGTLKGDALSKAYTDADVFCLPTLEEGLALVLGEALSFGLPIIATENSGADEIIKNGEEGFIVPIRSAKDIADKLSLFMTDEKLLHDARSKALIKSKTLSGWDANAQLLTQTLASLSKK